MTISFLKMHGLGNDFVIIDSRVKPFMPTPKFLRAAGNRRRGIGCDQLLVLKPPQSSGADLYMAIYNSDGSEAGACGNATRCVASLLFAETGRDTCVIETLSGLLPVQKQPGGMITVDFGLPRLEWDQIPMARKTDTLHAPVASGPLFAPCCVNMGNPHAVFFVSDIGEIDLASLGPRLEHDPIFPERCNIEIAHVKAPDRISMRVWERGAGITEACGSGACAVLVASVRRGLSARRAVVELDGGELVIEWRDDGHVMMTGTATLSYRGEIAEDFGDEQNVA